MKFIVKQNNQNQKATKKLNKKKSIVLKCVILCVSCLIYLGMVFAFVGFSHYECFVKFPLNHSKYLCIDKLESFSSDSDSLSSDISSINQEIVNYYKQQNQLKAQEEAEKNKSTVSSSPVENKPQPITYGNAGRLFIPKYGFSARLFSVDVYKRDNSHRLQQYADMEDSAAVFHTNDCYIIGDHYNQGFSCINNLTINDTIYIQKADSTKTYFRCVECGDGINNGMLYYKGKNVLTNPPAPVCLYTCKDSDSYNVTCRFFVPC